MFDELVESSARRGSRDSTSLVVSCALHAIILLVLVIVPLVYYQTLPAQAFLTYLEQPPAAPPPPPPPPPVTTARQQHVVKLPESTFVEPSEVPDQIPPPMEDIPDITTLTTYSRGVLGGISGGLIGAGQPWVPNLVPGFSATPPPPPPPVPKKPVRVGGAVQTSKLIRRIAPNYPPLAKRARVEGMVLLQVLVAETGNVAEVKLLRGHPLLVQAAVDAVRQWKYSPTLLNDEPVPVIATVTVNFVLN